MASATHSPQPQGDAWLECPSSCPWSPSNLLSRAGTVPGLEVHYLKSHPRCLVSRSAAALKSTPDHGRLGPPSLHSPHGAQHLSFGPLPASLPAPTSVLASLLNSSLTFGSLTLCIILSFSFSIFTLLLSVVPSTGSYGQTDFDPRTWPILCYLCWVTVSGVSSLIRVASFCMWCVFTCILMYATVRAPMCKGQKSPPVLFLRFIHLVFETGSLTLSWRLPVG